MSFPSIADVESYIDSNITNNGTNSITGTNINTALNGIIQFVSGSTVIPNTEIPVGTGTGIISYDTFTYDPINGFAAFTDSGDTGIVVGGGVVKIYAGPNSTYIIINDILRAIKLTNVPTYTSDAAAITGGLSTGYLYKSTTGGVTNLHIVP